MGFISSSFFIIDGKANSFSAFELISVGEAGAAQQGYSVALSFDGNTALVGGIADDDYVGAAWVFVRNSTTGDWSQQGSKLVGVGVVDKGLQGYSVALSFDGNTALVRGIADDDYVGAAWVFIRNTTTGDWSQHGSKLVGTGAVGGSIQGASVALSSDGNTALVGGSFDDHHVGATWVFVRNAKGRWNQQHSKLVGTGAVGKAIQGSSVALSSDGNTALIGGQWDNHNYGAVWIFIRNSIGKWNQQGSKLVGTGVIGKGLQGFSVSLSSDGDTALVGGPLDDEYQGAAWIFIRNAKGRWNQQGSKLVGKLGNFAHQGFSVALSSNGNTALIGGDNQGFLFFRNSGDWHQRGAQFTAGNATTAVQYQGYSVSLSGDGNTALIGVSFEDDYAGGAWVLEFPLPTKRPTSSPTSFPSKKPTNFPTKPLL